MSAKSAKKSNKDVKRPYAENKSVLFHYAVLDSFRAGLVLHGWEVRAIRNRQVSIKAAWIKEKEGELWLQKCQIMPIKNGNGEMEPFREKKLLLNASEIKKIKNLMTEKGRSVLITKIFPQGRTIKAEIVVGKGKKQYEKRQTMKARDQKRRVKKDFGV